MVQLAIDLVVITYHGNLPFGRASELRNEHVSLIAIETGEFYHLAITAFAGFLGDGAVVNHGDHTFHILPLRDGVSRARNDFTVLRQ